MRAGIEPRPRKWVGGSFPKPRAREFCLPAPGHPQSGLLGFRVSTPQPPYQGGLLFLAARQTSNYRKREKNVRQRFVAQSDYENFAKASLRQMYADPGIAALARCNTSARTDCGPPIAAIAAQGETRVLVVRPSVFAQRQGLDSGEYVVLVVGHRRTYVRAWTVLWRGALRDALEGGCSDGVPGGVPGGVLCFHRRSLHKSLEKQL